MKVLHTGDWHVGRTIGGQSRADEHRAVLGNIVAIAEREAVDLVLVAGDVFDTGSPSAESEQIVYEALLGLGRVAPVIVISGNHDSAHRLEAVRPLLDRVQVIVGDRLRRPDDGGVVTLTLASGERVQVALLPFLTPARTRRVGELLHLEGWEVTAQYRQQVKALLAELCAPMQGAPDTVRILLGHVSVGKPQPGGGERETQLFFEEDLTGDAFPEYLDYVALGHIHRRQDVAAPMPTHYPGAPLSLDFGESRDSGEKSVSIVTIEPGIPVERPRTVTVSGSRPLIDVRGTLEELATRARTEPELADAWLRVTVRAPQAAGLADQVRALFAVESDDPALRRNPVVKVDREAPDGSSSSRTDRPRREGLSERALFEAYLAEKQLDAAALLPLFDEVLEVVDASA